MESDISNLASQPSTEIWLLLDWRLHVLLLLNFPLYVLAGRAFYGSCQAFFDAFPYVSSNLRYRRSTYSLYNTLIVNPDYPGNRPWLLFACTLVYLGVVAAEYAVVRAIWGPIHWG